MNNPHDSISKVRKDYDAHYLNEENLIEDPLEQFKNWLNLALSQNVPEPNAMTLSTVDAEGKPSSRIVLLRGLDEKGFVFFTNYKSKKGNDLMETPYASLNFFWPALEKQVRIEGHVVKTDFSVSDEYFNSRPRESQLGAWASFQSAIISSRVELEQRYADLEKKYEGQSVPRPETWGGYCVIPYQLEFWQGRPNRLHDRFQFQLLQNTWKITRLSP